MHTFSPTPTQYEIESWIFPHPGVRRLQDASNPGPQRHSLHPVTPRVKATKEGEARARLKKGHRRWHSNENRIHHGGPHGSKENKSKGESVSVRTGSLMTAEDGKGRTKRHSKQGILEPKHHSSALRVSPEGENRSRGDNGMPFQTVSDSWNRRSDVAARPSELLGARVSPSHRPHKQPWVSKLSAPLPSSGHSSLTKQTQQLLHQPSYSRRQSATALELHSADLRALLRSLSCRSWTMGAESGPSEAVGESGFTILRLVVTHSKPPSPSPAHLVEPN